MAALGRKMTTLQYIIRDKCREQLTKYTKQAFSYIPIMEKQYILDVGCGTGVSTLSLAETINAFFHCVDPDETSIERFKTKLQKTTFSKRFKVEKASIYDKAIFTNDYDVILAEGLLNIIGFKKGLNVLKSFVKNGGYIIIHDESKDDPTKRKLLTEAGLRIITTIELSKDVWWNDYYSYLEKQILKLPEKDEMKEEMAEIGEYKKRPEAFSSRIYVLKCK